MIYHASFQDVLFVLAGIAWVAYSAYRSNKKRENTKKEVSEKKYTVFDALLDEVIPPTGIDNNQEKSEISEQVATPFAENASLINNGDYTPERERFYESVEKETKEEMNDFELDEEKRGVKKAYDQKEQKVNRLEFDLKKAFIYSEILNRKYI